jgi:hypothetical protein
MNRIYIASLLSISLFSSTNTQDFVTKENVNQYKGLLFDRIDQVSNGLFVGSTVLSTLQASSFIGSIWSWGSGVPIITDDELDMFHAFEGLNHKTVVKEFQIWFEKIDDNTIKTINSLLRDGKEKQFKDMDLFNRHTLHPHTAQHLFADRNLTVNEINTRVKAIPVELENKYKEEMFLRVTCDSLYRTCVLPTLQ